MGLFISYALEDPAHYFSWVLVVMFSICVHEYAHAAIALWLGDDTAASQGHLTLNPLVQMGPTSIVMLLVIGIAWGAVPVNPGRFRTRAHRAWVSFAGPGSNLLLCALFGLLAAIAGFVTSAGETGGLVLHFLWLASAANGVLFVFNMMPVPMFDGWSVFAILFPRMHDIGMQQGQTISWIFLALVFLTNVFDLIWAIGMGLADVIMRGWIALISLFL